MQCSGSVRGECVKVQVTEGLLQRPAGKTYSSSRKKKRFLVISSAALLYRSVTF